MSDAATPMLVLVKHAQPVLDASRPPREWRLGLEGEAQAARLADALRRFAPFRLVSSSEPKAIQTSGIVAERFGIAADVDDELCELDRPAQPIVAAEAHAALNEQLFVQFDQAVAGAESARAALDRFGRAVRRAVSTSEGTIVLIAHGTVISLFAGSTNASLRPFELWKRMRCPSFVVFDARSFVIREIVEQV